MTNPSGLDLLAVMDILKNEKLYRKRLDELNEATKKLADQQWITATLEQVKVKQEQIDQAKLDFESNKEILLEQIKKEKLELDKNKEMWEKLNAEKRIQLANKELEFGKERQKFVEQSNKLLERQKEVQDFYECVNKQQQDNDVFYQKYNQRIQAIIELINKSL